MEKLIFTYKAPKGAKVGGLIKQLAFACGLNCRIKVTKGWFSESGEGVCEGEDENVIRFKNMFESALND